MRPLRVFLALVAIVALAAILVDKVIIPSKMRPVPISLTLLKTEKTNELVVYEWRIHRAFRIERPNDVLGGGHETMTRVQAADVVAFIDLANISDLSYNLDSASCSITTPPVEVRVEPVSEIALSYVYGGLSTNNPLQPLRSDTPELARELAVVEIGRIAINAGLIDSAQASATRELRAFAAGLGYRPERITITIPESYVNDSVPAYLSMLTITELCPR